MLRCNILGLKLPRPHCAPWLSLSGVTGKARIADFGFGPRRGRGRIEGLWLAFAALLLAACTEDGERSQLDRIRGDIPPPETVTDARSEEEQASFPNLGSVPDGPAEATSEGERSRLRLTLSEDRARAGFTDSQGLPALKGEGPSGAGEAANGEAVRSEHIADIFFPAGSAALARDDREVLEAVARLHRTHGGILRVVGHASGSAASVDAVGDALSNFRLSMARADAVAAGLEGLGVARRRLVIEAQSDRRPIHKDPPGGAAAGNQRAEVFLEY